MATNISAAMTPPMDDEPRDQAAEAQELLKLRDALGYTQERLAQKLGVTHGTYWRWEKGGALCPLMALELLRAWAREQAQDKRSPKPTKRKA